MFAARRPAPGRGGPRRLSGERGIVSSLFVWSIVVFALLGLALNEVGHVIVAKSSASNVAQVASDAAEDVYKATRNAAKAQAAALQAAADADSGAQIVSFNVGRDRSVTVTVEVVADTVLVHRVSALKGLGVLQSTATSRPVSG